MLSSLSISWDPTVSFTSVAHRTAFKEEQRRFSPSRRISSLSYVYARHHFTVKSWLRAFCKLVSAQFQFGRERNQLMVNFSLGELEIFVIPQRLRSLLLLLWRISDIRLN